MLLFSKSSCCVFCCHNAHTTKTNITKLFLLMSKPSTSASSTSKSKKASEPVDKVQEVGLPCEHERVPVAATATTFQAKRSRHNTPSHSNILRMMPTISRAMWARRYCSRRRPTPRLATATIVSHVVRACRAARRSHS